MVTIGIKLRCNAKYVQIAVIIVQVCFIKIYRKINANVFKVIIKIIMQIVNHVLNIVDNVVAVVNV